MIKHLVLLNDANKHYHKEVRLTPVKAIRIKCLQCCANQYAEIQNCPVIDCALYPYRLGKRPS